MSKFKMISIEEKHELETEIAKYDFAILWTQKEREKMESDEHYSLTIRASFKDQSRNRVKLVCSGIFTGELFPTNDKYTLKELKQDPKEIDVPISEAQKAVGIIGKDKDQELVDYLNGERWWYSGHTHDETDDASNLSFHLTREHSK